MSDKFRKRRPILVVFLLLMTMLLVVSVSSAQVDGSNALLGSSYSKIHPNLMADIEDALAAQSAPAAPMFFALSSSNNSDELQFVARVKAGTDLSQYSNRWFARPFVDPLGSTVISGYASPMSILKMAEMPEVISLRRSESLVDPPQPVDPDVSNALNREIEPSINLDPEASPGPAPEGWYGTGDAIHGSQAAWDKGYTGANVRYMSNDSGADYCHPDLLGTWSYNDDEASPYYGLPEMFDSWSSYMAAFDYYLGTSRIANGEADYADTSATAAGNFNYAPIGASVPHAYTVPGTSLSGEYHYGSHPDKALAGVADVLSGAFGDGTAVAGERAAVLVVDENTAGVYDTVYVDLNYNFDFTDDVPARMSRDFTDQEAACLDYDVDGLNDVSGGLVYFISDGVNALPTLDWLWGIPGSFFGNGDLVAFHVMDYFEGGGDHGMGTTSVAVGQGVVIGSLTWGPDGSPIADNQGLVVGPGKDVLSTQNGNWYISVFIEDGYIYAGLGYDGIAGTGDDIQIVSNSWGFSGTDNDGFDYDSRLIDEINRTLAPNTALIFSTGNGAPGYGTVAPPSPPSGIGVGASTLYGTIGLFEAIESADQILGGDVMSWSNRGPGMRNTVGADVVATGAFGTGDVPLNQTLWGAIATDNFGGTSMAGPVAAGNLALMYQAWYEANGEWPTFEEAKTLLMGSSTDTKHDAWSQGAGLVNADIGTDVAGGHKGIMVSPSQWSVGDYRGDEYDAFAHIIEPGDKDKQTFTLTNVGNRQTWVRIKPLTFTQIGSDDYSFTSLDQSLDHGDFITPDYVFRIDQEVPRITDLLMVRVTKPYEQFDPSGAFGPYSNWRVHLQNWTDLNGDGEYWIDENGNGKVDLDGEMQTGEHIRFSYGYNVGPTQQVRISDPHKRIDDGLLLTFRHRNRLEEVPTTDLTVEASYWVQTPWTWVNPGPHIVRLKAGQSKDIDIKIKVPKDTPYGMYEGTIVFDYGREEVVVPVTVAVSASGTSFSFGDNTDDHCKHGYAFGKCGYYEWIPNWGWNPKTALYDNSAVFGYTDYSWRAESGDWRFFWTDVTAEDLPAEGSSFLVVDNSWESQGTDIDTLVYGPTPDDFSPSPIYGPYTLELQGGSPNTYIGSGRWTFNTSSGGPREIVSAPVQEGLHALLLHQVRVDGDLLDEPFGGVAGLANLNPDVVMSSGAAGAGSLDLTISSEIALEDFVAEGFGLGSPETTLESIDQDDPDDYTSGSVYTVDIENGALLEVNTEDLKGDDIDLFVEDPDGVLVGASTSPTGVESVSVLFPEDGTYTIYVQGWSVTSDGIDNVLLTINAVQGYDVSATNLPAVIPADGSDTVTVEWDTTGFDPGTYFGLVLMGPADAPALFQIPVEIVVE